MKWVELAGLVKFDFLGLKTLDVLAKAVNLLSARGVASDLGQIPLDDATTYELIARGDTSGVFQLESAGMRDSLRKLKPNRFEDIIAMNALYRPGPMDSIPNYIKCKNGEEPVYYPHPMLEPILEPTFGVFTYQEQVMQAARVMADYSLGGADLLRRAMGKKIKSEMEAQRANFVAGATRKGIEEKQANFVFDLMEKFSGYGFNKSHSAPYALIAYQTAYLKANYPVEFLAASMTLDMGNTDKLNQYRQEVSRFEIAMLPPDINRSEVEFTVEPDPKTGKAAIRYALAAVKGVGQQAMHELVAERQRNGVFKDLFDFARRLDTKSFNRRQFENLVKAGAFECLNPNRAQSFAAAELLLRQASRAAEERITKQESLFAGVDAGFAARPSLPVVADWPAAERLQNEFEAIGFYLSSHPLDPYVKSLERAGILRWVDLPAALAAPGALGGSTRFRLAGIVIGKKERTSARGNRFAFIQLSDTSGAFEVTVFSETLAQARGLLDGGQPLIVTVDVRRDEENLRLTVQRVEPLDTVVAQAAAGLRIFVAEAEALPRLRSVISREAGGRGRVTVVLDLPSREIEVALPGGFRVDPRIRAAVKSLPGIIDVHDI
jgi:DNA polymerase-3 subunit alpha